MKKEYDLKKLKKRSGKVKSDSSAVKTPISLRIDAKVLLSIRTEAERLGIPYQTFISSILYRYSNGQLVDLKSVNIDELVKNAS